MSAGTRIGYTAGLKEEADEQKRDNSARSKDERLEAGQRIHDYHLGYAVFSGILMVIFCIALFYLAVPTKSVGVIGALLFPTSICIFAFVTALRAVKVNATIVQKIKKYE